MQNFKKLISCSTKAKATRENALSNPSLTQNIPTAHANSERRFIIYHKNTKIILNVSESELPNLKISWLINEASSQLNNVLGTKAYVQELSAMVSLTTSEEDLTIDYFLTVPQLPLSLIPDGVVLKPYLTQELSKVDRKPAFEDFEFLTILGRGGSSTVFLARMKTNCKFYAIKRISKQRGKSDCFKYRKCALREKTSLAKVKSEFVAQMHFTFQTQNNFYFVIDYIPGGDLYHMLIEKFCFDEETAKFYVAELLLGIQYLHDNNIIYRDLKPDNLLFDIDGHLRFIDFGLSKTVNSKKEMHYSFSGTPEYMAPEIMVGLGYNCLADFYSLGALTYELVYGVPPFRNAGNSKDFYKNVMDVKPKYPSYATREFIDFVEKLLDKRPFQRLGARGIEEIINHPWLANVDFKAIQRREIKPPITIDLERFALKRTITQMAADGQGDEATDGWKVPNFSYFSLSELGKCINLALLQSPASVKNEQAETTTSKYSGNSFSMKCTSPRFINYSSSTISSPNQSENKVAKDIKNSISLEVKLNLMEKLEKTEEKGSADQESMVPADANHHLPYQTRTPHAMFVQNNKGEETLARKTTTEFPESKNHGSRLLEGANGNYKFVSKEPEWRITV